MEKEKENGNSQERFLTAGTPFGMTNAVWASSGVAVPTDSRNVLSEL